MTGMAAPPDLPRWRQIADDIRDRINRGEFPPGAMLPIETDLGRHYSVSRESVRRAIGALRAEGLILTARRRGSQVRPKMPIRRLDASRYRLTQLPDGARPNPADLDHAYVETVADGMVAERLQVEVGTPVLARHYVHKAFGTPYLMSTSFVLLDMVAGTPVADPANEPWPGGVAEQLASLGFQPTRFREEVRTRMPTAEECETLQIADAVPVFAVVRTLLAGDRPVEAAAEVVIPGDRTVLDYTGDL